MIEKEIMNIFDLFNEKTVNYFVLRDFENINRIYNSMDIDIFCDKRSKKKVDMIFKKNGWYTPFINVNKYSHKQYYKIIGEKIYKFDIVFDFYFGEKNYYFNKSMINYDKHDYLNSIKVADNYNAFYIMLFHIIYDKKCISEKNYRIFKNMFSKVNKDLNKNGKELWIISNQIVNNELEETNYKIREYQIQLNKFLTHNPIKNSLHNLKYWFFYILKYIIEHLRKKSIAIIGVDGSGKSSAVKSLKAIFGEKAEIIYMGMKDYQLNKLNILLQKENCNIIEKVYRLILSRYEFFYRYFKYRFSRKVVIFDRYVDDIYINANKNNKFRIIDKLLYGFLFPKPNIKIYLYCNIETSLERKSDITDVTVFSEMKKRYDKFYLNRKKVLCINTSLVNEENTIKMITNLINENYPFFMI